MGKILSPKTYQKSYVFAFVGILIIVAFVLYKTEKKTSAQASTKTQEKSSAPLPSVVAAQVKSEELFEVLTYPARITSQNTAALIADREGIIRNVKAKLGQAVNKNQVLFSIENIDPAYNLQPFQVLAPVHGVISQLLATEGMRINKGGQLGQITDPQSIKLIVEVPANDLAQLKTGQKAQFSVDEKMPPLSVQISGISPSVDPATQTATCELILSGIAPKNIVSGMIGKVIFKVNAHQGIRVKEDAIVYHGDKIHIRLVGKDNKIQQIPVTLGKKYDEQIEILSGLKANDHVVVLASTYLKDGDLVVVQNSEIAKP